MLRQPENARATLRHVLSVAFRPLSDSSLQVWSDVRIQFNDSNNGVLPDQAPVAGSSELEFDAECETEPERPAEAGPVSSICLLLNGR